MSILNSEKTLNTTELIEDIYPLSPIQQGLLFHTLLSPNLDIYFQQIVLSIESAIDVDVLASVWQRMAQRHSVFRTAFFWEGLDLSMQIVHSKVTLPLFVKDLRIPADEQQARIDQYLADEQKRGFNLSEAPLWRLALLRTADDQYKFILSFHHLLVDGWSIMLLLKEAKALYEASCRGVDLQLPSPRPYSDYIGWLDQQDLNKAKAWWRERLQDFSEVTALPFASAVRRPVQFPEHRFKSLRLSRAETTALEDLVHLHQLTMNTVLLGAWGLLLGRHSGQSDVVFGITVSGRNPELAGVESMVGLFINTLPVRVQWGAEESVVDWLKRVQHEQAASFELAHTPLVEIQGWSEIERSMPLFETLLVFQNYSTETFEERYGTGVNGNSHGDGRLKIAGVEFLDRVNYPLALVIAPEAELELRLHYHASRFSEANVERVLQHLRQILQSIGESGGAAKQKVREVKWMSADERAQVVEEWNRTEEAIPARCMHELFEEQVAKTPEATAVEYKGQQLTYTELNQRANQLARYLQKRGVGPEVRVGVYLDRTENLIIGFLAVLKAGGAYVPLDPNYPLDRLNFMIEETGLQALLTISDLAHSLSDFRISTIKLDHHWEIISQETSSDLPASATTGNLAYLIYTSGSTGTPKGVQIEHRGMLNHLTAKISDLQLTARDVVAETAPSSFDISVWQMLAILLTGGRVQIIDNDIARDAFQLLNEMQRTGVTVLETVPALLQMMVEGHGDKPPELPKLRWMISNAEALPISLCEMWKRKYPGIPLVNAYGPTECSDDISHYVISGLEEGLSYAPLGRPLMNTKMYVLDEEMEPVPVDVPGELYIGGTGVGRGYWKRGGLTAESFVPNPFTTVAGERLYRTGDVVRQRPDGTLDFIGRRDYQVKIRGFRVELGEIETALLEHEGVKQAVVVVREDHPGHKRLVAYVVQNISKSNPQSVADQDADKLSGGQPSRKLPAKARLWSSYANRPLQTSLHKDVVLSLREFLGSRLPEYMVPSAFVVLQELPLNANGKVDRKRLPEPQVVEAGAQDQKPRTVEEEILCGIWEQVLKVERVGVEENFFAIGGHSLLATQVVSRMREAFGVEMPLRVLFERPTIAGLAEAVKARGQEGAMAATPLVRVENRAELPLSFAQQRLWFLEQMEPGNAVYNVPFALRMRGDLDRGALDQSIRRIVERHEALRTVFVWNREQEPVQRLLSVEEAGVVVKVMELGELAPEQREAEARRLAGVEAGEGFNLSTGPLLRAKLLGMGEQEHVLLVTMHHIVSDGWSVGVLVREFMELYAAEREQREAKLEELPIQYGDYAAWQREWLEEGGELQEQMEYWKEQLAGLETLELPTDHPRPAVMSHRGATVEMELGEELTSQVRELCRREGVTLFMALLAGVQVLLGRYAGQQEVAAGTPIANRTRQEIEPLIGFFVNTLVLRGEVRREWSFREMLKRVREVTLAAYAHQDVPFEHLVEELQPVRDLSRNPLFEVMLIVQNTPQESFRLPGLSVETLGTEGEVAKFDLTFSAAESGGKIRVGINYATELYEQETIERMGGHFRAVVEEMTRNADSRIGEVTILSDAERAQLEGWNRTEREYPQRWVHELFEDQVKRTPEAVAVEYEDERLNYQELNRRANQLAHYLRSMGVGPEVRVGICMERSLEMVVAIMAVLKAGGAYVPLDPAYPATRLEYMLEDTQAPVLLTQSNQLASFAGYRGKMICVEREWERMASCSAANPVCEVRGENLAYVIYTSGSTGRPKGVGIRHASVGVLLQWGREAFSEEELSGVLAGTSICFDLSVFEIFVPLSWGGKTIIAGNALELPEMAGREQVRLVNTVPSVMKELVGSHRVPGSVITVNLAGEALLSPLVRQVYEVEGVCRVLNLYGPSEDTTYSTGAWIREEEAEAGEKVSVSIGKPLANKEVYVLDEELQLVPVGVVGELYIGGAGLARGYVNRPGVTAERFVPNPFARCEGERLYRTGDRVRWRSDGNLEYLGRLDQQVKVRGYRIELGEIEAALQKQAGVREAVVVAREDVPGEKRLVAYYTCREQQTAGVAAKFESEAEFGNEPGNGIGTQNGTGAGIGNGLGAEELRRHLAATLPDYMVPAAYVWLQQLPLTANGKLDRKALPQPEGDAYAVRGYQAPVGEVEQKLAVIWAEVLKVERVGRQDNFFALGGHSLLAITLIERMRRSGLGVDVRTLFAQPTLADLAAAILKRPAEAVVAPPNRIPTPCQMITPDMVPLVELTAEEIEQIVGQVQEGAANVQDIYPLAPLQEGIFFHHLMDGGESDPYVLGALLRFDRQERLERFVEALQKVVDRHDILRTAVLWEGLSQPVQVVQRRARLEVEELADEAQGSDEAGRVEETGVEEDGRGNAGRQDAGQQLYERFHPRRYRMDVRRAPLLRLHVRQDRQDGRWLMVLLLHHLAGDHSTLEMMREEVRAHLEGREKELLVPLPFRNLVAQARLGISEQEHENFFRQMLGDVDEPTAPFGLHDVRGDGSGIEEARLLLNSNLAQRLRSNARRLGVSAASVCHLAWGRVLAQVTGREQVVFGTVLFGRMQGGEGRERVMGLFINTLPVRILIGKEGVEASLRRTQILLADLLRHEHASLSLAQRCSGVPATLPLFTALLNYRHSRNVEQAESDAKGTGEAWEGVEWERGEERTNYPFILSVDDLGEGFRLAAQTVEWVGAERVCRYMERALESMVEALEKEPEKAVRSVAVLPEEERQQVVYGWNRTEQEYPQRCVHELFEEQASRTPKAIALEYEGQRLTYGELNRRANQLGHYLRKLGVGPEVRVGICVERSLEMVIGLLGILKAGGAYVPLDPAYPAERLAYTLQDAQIDVIVTEERWAEKLRGLSATLVLWGKEEQEQIACQAEETPMSGVGVENLLYVIYTSGSTGKPKGTEVPHRSVPGFIYGIEYARFDETTVWLQHSSLNWDVPTLELWPALLRGGRCVLARPGVLTPGELQEYVRESRVNTVWLTATQFSSMVEADVGCLEGIRLVLTGGEKVGVEAVKRVREELPDVRVVNGYGPSECTVFSNCYVAVRGGEEKKEIARERWESGGGIPIGKPIGDRRVYVLDRWMEPVPIGVEGEIYIGGASVARGYLRRTELTAERFVPDPFSKAGGERLYRTGDRARWRSDGNLEYLGRVDQQVKIRGYRIEMGEIESVLREQAGIAQAVVMVQEDGSGDKRLVAYVVGEVKTEVSGRVELEGSKLRQQLREHLPEYMVPSAYVQMEELPRNANGKLDRKRLPKPEGGSEAGYQEPQGEVEQVLADIWKQVLRLERVGREDNFLELGGDSILSIKVVARAMEAGVEITVQQIFQHQRLREVARVAGSSRKRQEVKGEEEDVRGELELTAIQQWFFEQELEAKHHFNQALLLSVRSDVDGERLGKAVEAVLNHHDAVRLRYWCEEGRWKQRYGKDRELEGIYTRIDLRGLEREKRKERMEEICGELQRSLDLERGPLVRVAYFELEDGESGRLFWVIHHLIIDGVSWRILLEDMHTAWEQLGRSGKVKLPQKTASLQKWVAGLKEWVESGELEEEESRYWLSLKERESGKLPRDYEAGRGTVADSEQVVRELGEKETEALLREAPRRHQVQIQEALLTALVDAVGEWTGEEGVLVEMEGHGREAVPSGVNVTRTVGWFTTFFPVWLGVRRGMDVERRMEGARRTMMQVPRHGIGYSLLRYFGKEELRKKLGEGPQAEISFNYLGQLDEALPEESIFTAAEEQSGPSQDERQKRSHALGLLANISNGKLRIALNYSREAHRRKTVENLAAGLMARLNEIANLYQNNNGHSARRAPPEVQLSDAEMRKLLSTVSVYRPTVKK